MKSFFKHLFQRGDVCATMWCYIIANMSSANIFKADISILCARFDANHRDIREFLAFGESFTGKLKFGAQVASNGFVTVCIKPVEKKELSEEDRKLRNDAYEVMDYLNLVLKQYGKRGYKRDGKTAHTYIKRRLKDGFTVDDFKDVIEIKVAWLKDPKQHKYYRPQTLFSEKFESYLNETTKPIEQSKSDQRNEQFTDAAVRAANDDY